MSEILKLDVETIERYNVPVPRYTSYPTVPHWNSSFDSEDYKTALQGISDKDSTLSLYIHLPFCERRCSFCGCNTYITRREKHFQRYVDCLKKEIDHVVNIIGCKKKYSQFHIGGGTPTYTPVKLLEELLEYVDSKFIPTSDAEKSIEMHPSVTTEQHVEVLTNAGFNRFSLGVQDFDEEVQRKINRHQTYEETKQLVELSRQYGVEGINIDLIYGLPYQTVEGFNRTMSLIETIRPDRLAVYSYAHLPKVFKHQNIFPLKVIPSGRSKLELFLIARERLLDIGYLPIGFDHFALEDDELWRAYRSNDLNRNFMGYTTHAGSDLVAFGFSAISDVNGVYAQNSKTLDDYYQKTEAGELPVIRGLKLSEQDIVRREAITTWLCQFKVSPSRLREMFGATAEKLIQDIEHKFVEYVDEGLMKREGDDWVATELGKIFARLPASAMDEYLEGGKRSIFSKSI